MCSRSTPPSSSKLCAEFVRDPTTAVKSHPPHERYTTRANRVLTASARGTTQWSRAVLATRVRASLKKHKKEKLAGTPKPRKDTSTEKKRIKLPAVERKLKILGRLVPGCRKVTVPNLLDEATDYIAALEMQVRAMESLAELLAATAPRSTLIRP